MKKIFFLFIIIAIIYFWTAGTDSGVQKVKTSIAGFFSSDLSSEKVSSADYLAAKREELQAYENALKDTDAQIEQFRKEAESQICPQTGRPGVFILKEDPRPGLREKIDRVQQEIARLERTVNK
ncbi:MAG: hypothetical protein FD156_2779 [Nitrospirae bacterium]|nr:MAG: hypothetical protein FD156_2779 [Nitrospirota bacterium]